MKNYSIIIWGFLFLTIFPNYSMAENTNTLYGFTENGIFYIHNDLIKATGGQQPKIMTGANKWHPTSMGRKGEYYVWQAKTTGSYRFPLLYCFDIGNDQYIPHALVDLGSPLIHPKHIKPNNLDGYNFFTTPQSDLPSNIE